MAGLGLAGLLAVVAAAVWLVPAAGALTVKRADIEIAQVRRAPFADYLPLRAEAAPLLSVYATAVEGGQVSEVLAQDGARVTAGQPLARLVNPQLQLDVTAREAEIAGRLGDVSAQQLALQRARAERQQQVDAASFDLLKARRELERRETLRAKGIESDVAVRSYADEAAYDAAKLAALKQGQAQESALGRTQEAQVRQLGDQLRRNLDVVHASLGALVVHAPVAGRLTNFTLQPGQSLKAGDSVGQVDSESAYKLTADIDEFYLSRVAVGQAATTEFDGHTVGLRVLRVLPQVTAGRFRAEFAFAGSPPAGLRRGQGLDLRLTLGDTRPAIVLPNGAWMEGSGGAFAFVVTSGGGRAERRTIVTGRRNPQQVEVLRGLQPGDRVVTSSYAGYGPYKHLLFR